MRGVIWLVVLLAGVNVLLQACTAPARPVKTTNYIVETEHGGAAQEAADGRDASTGSSAGAAPGRATQEATVKAKLVRRF